MIRTVTFFLAATAAICLCALPASAQDDTLWLDRTDLSLMQCGWSSPKAGTSIDGNPLSIGGKRFGRGVGTHALSTFLLNPNGRGKRFVAMAGVDDETGNPEASVEFLVLGDTKIMWRSGRMTNGDAPKRVDLDISGVRKLGLLVTDAGDGIDYDHADWADSYITASGNLTTAELTAGISAPAIQPYILTPPPSPMPRINGPSVIGVRPGHPLLHTVPVTGDRPVIFAADGLPPGLAIDPASGRISGALNAPGDHRITLTATNARGSASRPLRIVVGEEIALTPDEQYSHISLWSLLAAPLLLGNDLARLDDFTLGLLTNDEVLGVNQDPLGKQGWLLRRADGREVWVRDLEDGSKAVGLFYPANEFSDPSAYFTWDGPAGTEMSLSAAELGFSGKLRLRDLWRQSELGVFSNTYTATVPRHGVILLRAREER